MRFLRSVSLCWAVLVDLVSFLSLMILRMSFRPPLVGDSFSSPEPEPEPEAFSSSSEPLPDPSLFFLMRFRFFFGRFSSSVKSPKKY